MLIAPALRALIVALSPYDFYTNRLHGGDTSLEHVLPKSIHPTYKRDPHNLYITDRHVNCKRANYPFDEWTQAGDKGACVMLDKDTLEFRPIQQNDVPEETLVVNPSKQIAYPPWYTKGVIGRVHFHAGSREELHLKWIADYAATDDERLRADLLYEFTGKPHRAHHIKRF